MNYRIVNLRNKYFILMGIIVILMVLKYFNVKCPFKALWEIPCPGCGMTRAWQYVGELRWQDAFRSHPLFPLVPIMLIAYLGMNKVTWRTYVFWGIIASLFIVVYIGRLLNGTI